VGDSKIIADFLNKKNLRPGANELPGENIATLKKGTERNTIYNKRDRQGCSLEKKGTCRNTFYKKWDRQKYNLKKRGTDRNTI
jgi:hypothetical protein